MGLRLIIQFAFGFPKIHFTGKCRAKLSRGQLLAIEPDKTCSRSCNLTFGSDFLQVFAAPGPIMSAMTAHKFAQFFEFAAHMSDAEALQQSCVIAEAAPRVVVDGAKSAKHSTSVCSNFPID